jgi:hypothetical protein
VDVDIEKLSKLYGQETHPYFIYAPRWISSSAGIRALHYLCHSLNQLGQKAYLVMTEVAHHGEPRISPILNTPILSQEMSEAYFRAGINPIVIYAETIPGNPLGSTCVIRYLLNYAGVLGGDEDFPDNEIIIAFSKKIAEHYSRISNSEKPPVLFLPPIDPRDFTKNLEKKPYQVVYAGKYRSFVGKPPKVGTLPTVEIFRDGPRMQSRKQVLEILRNATIVYSFENSSIVTEAILSGTPAAFVPNKFLGDIIAEFELGNDGIVAGESNSDLENAQNSIDAGIAKYYESIETYMSDLEKFVDFTQERASFEGFQYPVTVPVHGLVFSKTRLELAKQIFRQQGITKLARISLEFILRRLSWRFWLKRTRNK